MCSKVASGVTSLIPMLSFDCSDTFGLVNVVEYSESPVSEVNQKSEIEDRICTQERKIKILSSQ